MMKFNTLIIGGGHAAAMTASSLRNKKYSGSIAIIGEEKFYPYQRPPLSKDFLKKDIKPNKLYIKSEEFYKKNDIKVILNKKVESIVKQEKYIILDDGSKVFFEKLVLATGSLINTLPIEIDNSNVHYLRNIEDALRLKDSFEDVDHITIIGAGYIGLEVAASLVYLGKNVTIIDMDKRVMSRSIDNNLSNFFYKKHMANGVKFLFNQSVLNIVSSQEDKTVISLSNGTKIESDMVLVGIGVKPNIELAENIGLDCNNGIRVDEYGMTSEKDVYATGDCANHFNPILKKQLRLESVQNCVELSNTIAMHICGIPESYSKVPWFWSEQYNIKLQIAGLFDGYEKQLIRGDIVKEKFAIYFQKNEKLISVHCVNSPKDFLLGKKLINSQKAFELDSLLDSNLKFTDIV